MGRRDVDDILTFDAIWNVSGVVMLLSDFSIALICGKAVMHICMIGFPFDV